MAAALRSVWRRVTFGKFAQEEQDQVPQASESVQNSFTSFLGPFEAYVVFAQSILIWEKPLASGLAFVLFNAAFWIIVKCQCNFYFCVCTLAALVFVSQTWVNQIWPEIRVPIPEGEDTEEWTPVNPQVLSVPEISHYLQQMWEMAKEWCFWLVDLRRDQPGQFCILITCFLVSLAIVGHYISGVLISYILMTTVMLGPGFFVHIYPRISSVFAGVEINPHIYQNAPSSDVDELDEFLPEPSRETMEVLSCALDSPETDQEESVMIASKDLGLEDFVSNENEDFSLQAGLADLPSHDRDSEDDDEYVGHVDTMFNAPETVHQPIVEDPSMRFVSRHFNGDSDDSEEERLAMGLDFTIANESSNDSHIDSGGVSSLTVSMPSTAYPSVPPDDDHLMVRSVGNPVQLLSNQNLSNEVPNQTGISGDAQDELAETARSFSRQLSLSSESDLSDYEIVSDSEFL